MWRMRGVSEVGRIEEGVVGRDGGWGGNCLEGFRGEVCWVGEGVKREVGRLE